MRSDYRSRCALFFTVSYRVARIIYLITALVTEQENEDVGTRRSSSGVCSGMADAAGRVYRAQQPWYSVLFLESLSRNRAFSTNVFVVRSSASVTVASGRA